MQVREEHSDKHSSRSLFFLEVRPLVQFSAVRVRVHAQKWMSGCGLFRFPLSTLIKLHADSRNYLFLLRRPAPSQVLYLISAGQFKNLFLGIVLIAFVITISKCRFCCCFWQLSVAAFGTSPFLDLRTRGLVISQLEIISFPIYPILHKIDSQRRLVVQTFKVVNTMQSDHLPHLVLRERPLPPLSVNDNGNS